MNSKLLAVCLLLVPGAVGAAGFDDPGWPCIQRKVENLSPGLMWPDPVAPAELSPAAKNLAAALALRRVGLEQAETLVGAFVQTHPGADRATMGNIFLAVFDRLSADRRRLIAGIGRYAHGQAALAARIAEKRGEMDGLIDAEAPDYDRIDAIEEQLDWDERIYRDRERSLTYVCETPVLLEKRLYAIAQILQAAVPG